MLTYLLLVASIWGTDPNIVFIDGTAPLIQTQMTSEPSSLGTGLSEQMHPVNVEKIFSEPFVARGQTVSDDPRYSTCGMGSASIWEDPIVKQFIDEMNPFAPLRFQVLPNYYDPFGVQMGTGTYGQQGYRLGWSTFSGNSILPASHAYGTTGSMKIVEWNTYAKYSHVLQPGVIFNGTFWFNAHYWDGPGGIDLSGQVDQVSSDLEIGLFDDGPWSGQIAFHPQIVESYGGRLDKNAFNFDGRVVATYKESPQWSFVGGIAVWDRVNTLIIPHVGAVWTPNNQWEIRALFPKSRVSYFLGNWRNADFWLYGQYEYTAEAWQTSMSSADVSDRVQIIDQRLTSGLRWDSGRYSFYVEAGYVFDRHAKFAGATPSFDLDDCAIISGGFRY